MTPQAPALLPPACPMAASCSAGAAARMPRTVARKFIARARQAPSSECSRPGARSEITHYWRGFVCLAYDLVPYVGALDEKKTVWTAMAYHGNGVAMGSWSGRAVARLIAGEKASADISPVAHPPPVAFSAARLPPALSEGRLSSGTAGRTAMNRPSHIRCSGITCAWPSWRASLQPFWPTSSLRGGLRAFGRASP